MFHAIEIDLVGGGMAVSEQEYREDARGGTTGTEAAKGTQGSNVQRGHVAAEPITEISDKDYRSFCLPCDVLEETDEREQGR